MEYNFPVIRTTHPKPRPADETKLGFAKYFTDHMFVMDYDEGQGWHDGRVVPHEPFLIEPASCVLHYAQMMFEGMKAYRTPDGGVQIFRPDMNIKRMARTNERMCIPELPGDLFLAAVKAVIEADRDWIPSAPGTAMYIRPFIFGDEVSFSVLPAKHYKFMIILSPTGSYYAANDGGLSTTRIYVQDKYIRAAHGGTGYANGWFILPLLSGGTQFVSQWLALRKGPKEQQQQGKMMLYMFPVLSAWICLTSNSMFAIYWTFSNIYSMLFDMIYNYLYARKQKRLEIASRKAS